MSSSDDGDVDMSRPGVSIVWGKEGLGGISENKMSQDMTRTSVSIQVQSRSPSNVSMGVPDILGIPTVQMGDVVQGPGGVIMKAGGAQDEKINVIVPDGTSNSRETTVEHPCDNLDVPLQQPQTMNSPRLDAQVHTGGQLHTGSPVLFSVLGLDLDSPNGPTDPSLHIPFQGGNTPMAGSGSMAGGSHSRKSRTMSADGNPWADVAMNDPALDKKRFSEKVAISMVQEFQQTPSQTRLDSIGRTSLTVDPGNDPPQDGLGEKRISGRYSQDGLNFSMPPMGPRATRTMSEATTGSQADYHRPDQTIVIWDWDDTLHPSYWVKSQGMTVHTPVPPQYHAALSELSRISEQVMRTSLRFGRVVIITNAETGWAELSCKRWLPDLWPFVKDMTVISARSTFEPKGVESPAGWKTHAFKEVINAFYSRYPNQRWKNVLSIGDGRADREALHRVTEERLSEGCRQKNIKFLVKPSLDVLKKQLLLLNDVLETLIMTDDHIDIRITEEHLNPSGNPAPAEHIHHAAQTGGVNLDQEFEEKGPDGVVPDFEEKGPDGVVPDDIDPSNFAVPEKKRMVQASS